jgi:hypothetical protein
LSLRPAPPVDTATRPKGAAAQAHAGRMILDSGKEDCQQVTFNNETSEITGTSRVQCVSLGNRRAAKAPPRSGTETSTGAGNGGTAGLLGEMAKAFSRPSRQNSDN